MADQDDEMNQPVTRGELKSELKETEATLRGEMDRNTINLIDLMRRAFGEFRTEIRAELTEFRAELHAMRVDLARHANAIKEHVTRELRGEIEVKASSTELRVVDDKYADLPARVTKLERAVFPPKRQRRR